MSPQSPQPLSEEEAKFRDAMRRILSLTPAQREAVKRKVAEEAERQKPKKSDSEIAARQGKKDE